GFVAANPLEALFVAGAPPRVVEGFPVRRATPADLPAVRELFHLGHGYGAATVDALFGSRLAADDVGCWIAWDGDAPMSLAFITRIGRSLGLWDMLTAPAHRRRGAGRAVLTAALAGAAAWRAKPIDTIVFWSSPAGRPLYKSLGFTIADEVLAMTIDAAPEDLAAVGAA
ncbi:MAG: GNAT family N-acetyltransferase, partial [Candidatus Limnocylindrales bacterium]